MIEAVIIFGAMTAAFELVLLSMLSPRKRLRLLGSEPACNVMHVAFLVLNLVIHWGTLIGTMSGVGAFLCSLLTVRLARAWFGFITSDRYYTVGWTKYSVEELQ